MNSKASTDLKGKVALITGAGRGIGAATARLLAQQGTHLVLTARSRDELKKVEIQISKESPWARTSIFVGDLSKEMIVLKLWEKTITKFDTVDILVNNAGMIQVKEVIRTTSRVWDQTLALNLKTPFLLSKEMFKHYRSKKKKSGGAIVNISSLGGIRGTTKFPGFASYTASKAGVVGLTEVLAVEGRDYQIRANCIAPGAIATQMLKQAAPNLKTKTMPSDVAQVILYLCDSARSGALSGSTLEIFSNA